MREVVQAAPTGDTQSLEPEFTYEELFAELEALLISAHGDLPVRTPGGIDKYMVAQRKNCGASTARTWLVRLEAQGSLVSRFEWDETRRARVRVWRRKA